MPDHSTSRRFLAYLLAVPVIFVAYLAFAFSRVWAALRPAVATLLGATVIGTVYADEAIKRAPATPMRIGAVLALAVVLVGPGAAPSPALASGNAADSVISAARDYLGHPYQLGAEGPKFFDCSGLVFRAFADAGELPRIGGMRLLARGYLRWFTSRGQFSKDAADAQPGDLVVWNNGEHIGIYLGEGQTISAIINPYGVKVHSLSWVGQKVTQFLLVRWGDGNTDPGNDPGDDPGDQGGDGDNGGGGDQGDNGGGGDQGDNQGGAGHPGVRPDTPAPAPDPRSGPGNGNNRGSRPDDSTNPNAGGGGAQTAGGDSAQTSNNEQPSAQPAATRGAQATATGTLNMRDGANPDGRIIGWVSRGQQFRIIGRANSPSGWLWYQVRTASGKEGWLFSYWVREV